MSKIIMSEELPTGAKTADVLRAIKGRLWGEDTERARLLYWDLEHGVADVEVTDSNKEYAVASVTNHREQHKVAWLVGVSADREDMVFVHPHRSRSGFNNVQQALDIIERRDLGFARRIQGDVMMAVGTFEAHAHPHAGPGASRSWIQEPRTYQLALTVGSRNGQYDHRFGSQWVQGPEAQQIQQLQKGMGFGHHQVTCPKGISAGIWTVGMGLPVLVAFGTFDIAHGEHGGLTVPVPEGFVGILTLQDDGISHDINELAIGGNRTGVAFD